MTLNKLITIVATPGYFQFLTKEDRFIYFTDKLRKHLGLCITRETINNLI